MLEKELEIISLLVNVWNKYLELPEQHCCDRQEFCDAIHRLQHLVMIRDARRNHPDIFPNQVETTIEIENFDNEMLNIINNTKLYQNYFEQEEQYIRKFFIISDLEINIVAHAIQASSFDGYADLAWAAFTKQYNE
jgi:hypothetical protein